MPKPRKYELINCQHFVWRLARRRGVFYADGRSNRLSVGRHSLGTRDREEALRLLADLDLQRAIDLALRPPLEKMKESAELLSLSEGRRLYEERLALPKVAGGVAPSTQKKYRSTLDKFFVFAHTMGIESWNQVDRRVLERYAAYLVDKGHTTPKGRRKEYSAKSLFTELQTLKSLVSQLAENGHLVGIDRIVMPLTKPESQRAYCWRLEEVTAMIIHCRARAGLKWLADVIIALACTGLRISELASLRWSDLDFEVGQLSLTDETGYRRRELGARRIKSGHGRSFPIHPHLMSVLTAMPRNGTYVFRGPRGGRLKADTVRNVLIGKVLTPLAPQFPAVEGAKGFQNGRLHSFRHYFCSRCANENIPERVTMLWLGHGDSEMVRHYFHLHSAEAKRQMNRLDLLGDAGKQPTGSVNRAGSPKSEESPSRDETVAT